MQELVQIQWLCDMKCCMCQTSNFVRYSVLNREPAAIVIGGEEDSVGTDGWMTSLAKLFYIRCSECMFVFAVLCKIELQYSSQL